MEAELILTGGVVRSPDKPEAKHQALAVAGGRILAVGSDRSVKRLAGKSTRALDLRGGAVLPGFVDCHAHLVGLGRRLMRVSLSGCTSADEAVERVRRKAEEQSEGWILGRGWDDNEWRVRPHRAMFDAAVPGRKVLMRSFCGHSGWASTPALEDAGISPQTPDPEGGRIERDEHGEPTGVLRETAQYLLNVPEPTKDETERGVELAQEAFHGAGITGMHDCESLSLVLPVLSRLDLCGRLSLRVLAMSRPNELDWIERMHPAFGFGSASLRLGPVKMFLDGSITSHTAWVYTESGTEGLPVMEIEQLESHIRRANSLGYPVAIHSIGDVAVRSSLDAIERAGDRRILNRIEHASMISPQDVPRFKELNVIASVQPCFVFSDWPKLDKFWNGAKGKSAYPFASLLRAGATLLFGSDAPVELPSAVEMLYAAVTRKDRSAEPESGWYPAECISVEEAVRAATLVPASLYGERRGRIAPGFDADFTVFSDDPYEVPAESLRSLEVTGTVVAGEVVHWS